MPSATTTFVSNADVDFYFTQVNTAFMRALKGNNKAVFPRIAYVPSAGARQTTAVGVRAPNGSTVRGTKVKFPVSLAASRPEEWQYGEDRKFEEYSQVEIEMVLKRWAPPAKREFYDVFDNDLFDVIKGQLPQMMDRAMVLWDMVLAQRFAENAVQQTSEIAGYDTLPFFTPASAPHQANPFKPGVASFYNDVAINGLDVPNMRGLLKLLSDVPGPDGLPLDTDEVKIVALAPDRDFGAQLKHVFQDMIVAETTSVGAAAGVSNQLLGEAEVILFKQLLRTRTAPTFGGTAQDRGRVGYLLAVPSGEDRACAVVPQRMPTAYYTGLNSSDHLRATKGAVEYGWDAFGDARLLFPHRALRFVLNPV